MLVLSRKINESIMIGDQIEIKVLEIRDNHIKLGIIAPRNVSIHRQEVFAEIREENLRAARQDQPLPSLESASQALRKTKLQPPKSQD